MVYDVLKNARLACTWIPQAEVVSSVRKGVWNVYQAHTAFNVLHPIINHSTEYARSNVLLVRFPLPMAVRVYLAFYPLVSVFLRVCKATMSVMGSACHALLPACSATKLPPNALLA